MFLKSAMGDFGSFLVSAMLLAAYHIFLRYKIGNDPTYTVQAINKIARMAWVETVMQDDKHAVLAVQTLRNSTMAATFLASTAVLMIIGVLTLSEQGDRFQAAWHALNIAEPINPVLWTVKLMLLLLDLFAAFFSFSMAIRMFNHVGYMINVPLKLNHKMFTPEHVATHLNRAGHFYSLGMRAYYFLVPLVFWLFGSDFMLAATIGLLVVLYQIDRAPKVAARDHGNTE